MGGATLADRCFIIESNGRDAASRSLMKVRAFAGDDGDASFYASGVR